MSRSCHSTAFSNVIMFNVKFYDLRQSLESLNSSFKKAEHVFCWNVIKRMESKTVTWKIRIGSGRNHGISRFSLRESGAFWATSNSIRTKETPPSQATTKTKAECLRKWLRTLISTLRLKSAIVLASSQKKETCICIYIYIYRERERYVCIYIHIYIYIERERWIDR